MPRPTSSILSRCCITWINPSTAPIIPTVGENPPADSKTAGKRSSRSAWFAISSSIILRNSCGSVPSTASINDFFKNGSVICANSESSDTIPSRRALFAYDTNSPNHFAASDRCSKNTLANRLNAARNTGNGNWMSTAPTVPPKTIIAAVGCTICPRLPPSSNNPSTMPPMATSNPVNVALSTGLFLLRHQAGKHFPIRQRTRRNRQPKLHYPLQHFVHGFPHHHLFSSDKRDHRVGRLLHKLDKVAVHHQRLAIQSR